MMKLLCRKMLLPILTYLWISVMAQSVFAQEKTINISINCKDGDLADVLNNLQKQTNIGFIFDYAHLQKAHKVTLKMIDKPLEEVLDKIFREQPLISYSYSRENKTVVVGLKETPVSVLVSGIVRENNDSLGDVYVYDSISGKYDITDADGSFNISTQYSFAKLKFSYVGYHDTVLIAKPNDKKDVFMRRAVKGLDEAIKMGHGENARRYVTGNIQKITMSGQNPVTSTQTVDILRGQVPGLLVEGYSGHGWGVSSILLRGNTSLMSEGASRKTTPPLFIVDGIPYPRGTVPMNQHATINGQPGTEGFGTDPMRFLNPGDIESVEILKDADATAIYGARGAGGVILVTTKRDAAEKFQVDVSMYNGWGKAMRLPKVLSAEANLALREEAYGNQWPAASELSRWDRLRNINFPKLIFGGTAGKFLAQVALSGKHKRLAWRISGSLRRQPYLLTVENYDRWGTGMGSLSWHSQKNRWKISMNIYAATGKNSSVAGNPGEGIFASPILPELRDADGLTWEKDSIKYTNPLAMMESKSRAETGNISGTLVIEHRLFKNFTTKVTIGGSKLRMDEKAIYPLTSQPLQQSSTGMVGYGSVVRKNITMSPQADYRFYIGPARIKATIGSSFQEDRESMGNKTVTGYRSDDSLYTDARNGKADSITQKTQYRYYGWFIRLNTEIWDRLLLNLTFREDVSSTFAPANRSAAFYSIGTGWIFSEERFFKNWLPYINFGKIRFSYGTAGNDGMGNNLYRDEWGRYVAAYGGMGGIRQINPYIPDYKWETTTKWEGGLEAEILGKYGIIVARSRHLTCDQLVSFTTPSQTGVNFIRQANVPAQVENKQWEFMFLKLEKQKQGFYWSFSANLTIPQNKLISLGGLENDPAYNILVKGAATTARRMYKYTGIDKEGLYTVKDVNGDGAITYQDDAVIIKDMEIKKYGGLSASFFMGGFSLQINAEARQMPLYNESYYTLQRGYPGSTDDNFYTNHYAGVQDRWPAKDPVYQRASAEVNASERTAANNYLNSNGVIDDEFYVWLRSVTLQYRFKKDWLKKFHLKQARVYLQVDNLWVVSSYPNGNPSFRNPFNLPAPRMVTFGMDISL